tara:strand:+ start:164 stop:682 length:519 start_codon:yes stop_codon:yes gene_type:complete
MNTGTTRGAQVVSALSVQGLPSFRKALKELGPEWPKQLTQAHRDIAKIAERVSQSEARSMGGVFAKAAPAIRGTGNARNAKVGVKPSKSARAGTAMANVAFWGALKRTGDNRAGRRNGKRQHPIWVGDSWDAAVAGQGPYAINTSLARHMDDIQDAYMAALDRLASAAFPDN